MTERISTAEARDLTELTAPLTERLLAADLLDARAEIAALRAILDGRTTPPTEAEIRAHVFAGGGWLLAWDTAAGPTQEVAFHGLTVLEALAHAAELNSLFLALPLGPDRRPCAWPVTP